MIKSVNELPGDTGFRMYCAEPSPEAAAADYHRKYGLDPAVIYHKLQPSGRSTVYIPVTAALTVIGSEIQITDRNGRSQKGPG